MNIVYSSSDLYSSLAGISLVSLLENNKSCEEINVFIIDNGISNLNKNKLISLTEYYNCTITFIPLSDKIIKNNINTQKWDISTFGRLFEASSLPTKVEKVIHIDCDTIINGSLEEIWNINMDEVILLGALDCLSDEYKLNIGLKPTDSYINAGFIVLNLKRIRELDIENKFLSYIERKYKLLTYVDQEVLNACIPEKEKMIMPLKYNSYSILHFLSYKQLKCLRKVNNIFSKKEFNIAKDSPVVLHYTSCFLEGTRPWITKDRHPKKIIWLKYKEISPWNDMNLWEDSRSKKQKILTKIIRVTPKWCIAPLVGYIHGVIIPKKNKRRQEDI